MTRLLALTVLCLVGVAEAQTYVRPSKGSQVAVYTLPVTYPVPAPPGTLYYSAFFDMTAFSAMQVSISYPNGDPGYVCAVEITVEGALDPTQGSIPGLVQDPDSVQQFISGGFPTPQYSYAVSNLPPYIRFKLNPRPTIAGFPAYTSICTSPQTVTMVPLPFNDRIELTGGLVNGTSVPAAVYPVVLGGNVALYGYFQSIKLDQNGYASEGRPADTGETGMNITEGPLVINSTPTTILSGGFTLGGEGTAYTFQNQSTQPVYCKIKYGTPVTTTDYQFVLPPSATLQDGTGPLVELPFANNPPVPTLTYNNGFECIVAVGTGLISVFARDY